MDPTSHYISGTTFFSVNFVLDAYLEMSIQTSRLMLVDTIVQRDIRWVILSYNKSAFEEKACTWTQIKSCIVWKMETKINKVDVEEHKNGQMTELSKRLNKPKRLETN